MSQHSANSMSSRSAASSSSSSFVDETGAGSSSSATVTSPAGTAQSSQTVFTPGATSSKGSATATGGSDTPPVATAEATAPVQNTTQNTTQNTAPATSSPLSIQENTQANTFVIPLLVTPTQDTAQLSQLLIDARTGGRAWLTVGTSGTITSGNAGANLLVGTGRNDQLFGRAGNDRCSGGAGNDRVSGGAGNDQVNGGQGNDVLYGNSGRDLLVGGAGQDLLFGGAEADVFALSGPVAGATQVDVCMDFDAAQGDRIRLPMGITFEDLVLSGVDTNSDSINDSTVIQASFSGQVQTLAVVLNTVTGGATTLNSLSFSTVG